MAPLVHIPQPTVSSACLVHSIAGSGTDAASSYTYHASIGASSTSVRLHTRRRQHRPSKSGGGWSVELWSPTHDDDDTTNTAAAGKVTSDDNHNPIIPIGHQDSKDGRTPCPVTADDVLSLESFSAVVKDNNIPSSSSSSSSSQHHQQAHGGARLATVAVVYDAEADAVLLTRRLSTMRTFPSAWVLPGGAVDPEDESLAAACLRELHEETGLKASLETDNDNDNDDDNDDSDGTTIMRTLTPRPLCLWESCFPTTFANWKQARCDSRRCAHHLIVYMLIELSSSSSSSSWKVQLQEDECDAAIWLPLSHLSGRWDDDDDDDDCPSMAKSSSFAPAPGTDGDPVQAHQIDGVYPNGYGEGIGRGHLFALQQLAALLKRARTTTGNA